MNPLEEYDLNINRAKTNTDLPQALEYFTELRNNLPVNSSNSMIKSDYEYYDNLIEEYKWNDLVYQSTFSFEPVIGKIYHLYYSINGSTFLSLVEPHEWNKEYLGSFRYNHDNKWVKI